jgi:beta-galactosidase
VYRNATVYLNGNKLGTHDFGYTSWIGAYCGDLDLTGVRKGQSYYRDILWNGGDRVYATVRLPDPEGNRTVAETSLKTVGPARGLRLSADRTVIQADGQDLSFVTVEAVDGAGQVQPNAQQAIEFSVSGPGVIAAVGTGDMKSPEPYQGSRRSLFNGRALLVVRSSGQPGAIKITAKSADLTEALATVRAEAR